MFAQDAQRDRELARIRENIRHTTREIVRLAKQEMLKARHRVQRQKQGPDRNVG